MKTVFIAAVLFMISSLRAQAQWTQGTNIITTTNSVGIGINPPSAPLEVFKTGNNDPIARFGSTTSTNYHSIWVYNGATSYTKVFICGANGNYFNGSQPGDGGMHVATGKSLFLGDGSGNAAIVLKGGNVGIGTLDTKGYKLAVAGNIIAEKVVVKLQANWPDYVFDSSYDLQPLSQVEHYIRQNKHLPGIAPMANIQKDGLDLGANQSKLLQKIEELTLYIIEQNKKIDIQAMRIRSLEQKIASITKK